MKHVAQGGHGHVGWGADREPGNQTRLRRRSAMKPAVALPQRTRDTTMKSASRPWKGGRGQGGEEGGGGALNKATRALLHERAHGGPSSTGQNGGGWGDGNAAHTDLEGGEGARGGRGSQQAPNVALMAIIGHRQAKTPRRRWPPPSGPRPSSPSSCCASRAWTTGASPLDRGRLADRSGHYEGHNAIVGPQ